MESITRYENYPVLTVIQSNLNTLLIYVFGFFIMYKLGLIFSLVYLAYILTMEFRIVRYHCTNCYYWGRTCGFGKGRISALFFKKGNSSKFCAKELTFRDMIPDILLSLLPLIAGTVFLIIRFEGLILLALFLIILSTTMGNGYIRGKKTCAFCKQKDLGCPAERLFSKK